MYVLQIFFMLSYNLRHDVEIDIIKTIRSQANASQQQRHQNCTLTLPQALAASQEKIAFATRADKSCRKPGRYQNIKIGAINEIDTCLCLKDLNPNV